MVRSKPELGRTVRMYVVYDMRRGSWGVSLQVRDHVATSFDAACVPVQGNRATITSLLSAGYVSKSSGGPGKERFTTPI